MKLSPGQPGAHCCMLHCAKHTLKASIVVLLEVKQQTALATYFTQRHAEAYMHS